MKILQLMPQSPWPAIDGGKVGLYNTLREFSRLNCETHLVAFCDPTLIEEARRALSVWTEPTLIPFLPHNSIPLLVKGCVSRRAIYMARYNVAAFREAIERVIRQNRFDVVHADHTGMGPFAEQVAQTLDIPWGLRLHNIEHTIWARYSSRYHRMHPASWYVRRQARLLASEEARLIARADVVFPITDVDAAMAERMAPDAKLVLANGGIDPDTWVEPTVERNSADVVLSTTYAWAPNLDSLRWFSQYVWPLVHRLRPDARFRVVGSRPPAWIFGREHEGILVDGFVDDIVHKLHSSTIAVAPLLAGSGVRIKVLESMAAGLPVVSTTIGAEGIQASEADGLLRVDDPNAMAQSIVSLLNEPNRCRELGKRARKRVLEKYTWADSVSAMVQAYRKLLR